MDRAGALHSQRAFEMLESLLRLPAGDLKATLNHVADVLAGATGANKVDAFLYEPARDSLVAVGTSTQPLSALQRAHGLDVLPLANGGCTVEVYKTGKTFFTGRLEDEAHELRGVKEALGVHSAIGVALEVGGKRRGLLLLASQQPDFFAAEDVRYLETISSWVGLVAHRAELAAEIARNAAEQGRRAGAEELVTVLAHDMRNYLAPIHMRLEVLRMRARQDAREDELRDVEALGRSIGRLADIINDILDVARIDRGILRIDPRPVDLAEVVRTAVSAFESAQHALKVTVQPGGAIRVSGEPQRLFQCLENLIANAIQKSPASAAVNIFVRRDQRADGQSWASVDVVDEGPGIPAEHLPRVFERFYSSGTGLGLGLYLAERIARLHGGSLSAESPPGRGARFVLSLPCLPD